MGLVVVPVLKGKEEQWKTWSLKFKGEMKKEFDDINKRHGLTRHDIWAVETPNGLMAAVLHEGPGADMFMQNISKSENDVDKLLSEKIAEFHGMDLSKPPSGPMPVKLV